MRQPRKFKTPITVRHKCHALPLCSRKSKNTMKAHPSEWLITLVPNEYGRDAQIEVRQHYGRTTKRITFDALIKHLTVPGAALETKEGGK